RPGRPTRSTRRSHAQPGTLCALRATRQTKGVYGRFAAHLLVGTLVEAASVDAAGAGHQALGPRLSRLANPDRAGPGAGADAPLPRGAFPGAGLLLDAAVHPQAVARLAVHRLGLCVHGSGDIAPRF